MRHKSVVACSLEQKSAPYQQLQAVVHSSVDHFRDAFVKPEVPAFLPKDSFPFKALPGLKRWFLDSDDGLSQRLNLDYLSPHGEAIVPLELTRFNTRNNDSEGSFERFHAPMSLFLRWAEQYAADSRDSRAMTERLYLAQASLSDLPQQLQADFPTPKLVKEAGRGDIYNVNLWIGLAPTYTPLHCDPNPNLFVQLAGKKVVRLVPPSIGANLYDNARMQLCGSIGAHQIRGEEMMQGKEKRLLYEEVWNEKAVTDTLFEGYQVHLGPGDGIFIPKGWWHSIRGYGGGVIGSANWWFR